MAFSAPDPVCSSPLQTTLATQAQAKPTVGPSSLTLPIPTFQFSLCWLPWTPSATIVSFAQNNKEKNLFILHPTPAPHSLVPGLLWLLLEGKCSNIFLLPKFSVVYHFTGNEKGLSLQAASHCLTHPARSSPRYCLQPSSIPTATVPAGINVIFPIRLPGTRELLHWRRGEKASKQNGERRRTKDRWNFWVKTCPSAKDTFSAPPGAPDLFHQSETSWLEICLECNYQLKDGTIRKE